jgi:hypothetical protein
LVYEYKNVNSKQTIQLVYKLDCLFLLISQHFYQNANKYRSMELGPLMKNLSSTDVNNVKYSKKEGFNGICLINKKILRTLNPEHFCDIYYFRADSHRMFSFVSMAKPVIIRVSAFHLVKLIYSFYI